MIFLLSPYFRSDISHITLTGTRLVWGGLGTRLKSGEAWVRGWGGLGTRLVRPGYEASLGRPGHEAKVWGGLGTRLKSGEAWVRGWGDLGTRLKSGEAWVRG